jgi:hypothetical protein
MRITPTLWMNLRHVGTLIYAIRSQIQVDLMTTKLNLHDIDMCYLQLAPCDITLLNHHTTYAHQINACFVNTGLWWAHSINKINNRINFRISHPCQALWCMYVIMVHLKYALITWHEYIFTPFQSDAGCLWVVGCRCVQLEVRYNLFWWCWYYVNMTLGEVLTACIVFAL